MFSFRKESIRRTLGAGLLVQPILTRSGYILSPVKFDFLLLPLYRSSLIVLILRPQNVRCCQAQTPFDDLIVYSSANLFLILTSCPAAPYNRPDCVRSALTYLPGIFHHNSLKKFVLFHTNDAALAISDQAAVFVGRIVHASAVQRYFCGLGFVLLVLVDLSSIRHASCFLPSLIRP